MTGNTCASSQARAQDTLNINRGQITCWDCVGLWRAWGEGRLGKHDQRALMFIPSLPSPVYFLNSQAADVVQGAPWMALTWSNVMHALPICTSANSLLILFCSWTPIYYSGVWVFFHLPKSSVLPLHSLAVRGSFTRPIIIDMVSGECHLFLTGHCPSSFPFCPRFRDFSLDWTFPRETGSQSLLSPPGTHFYQTSFFNNPK